MAGPFIKDGEYAGKEAPEYCQGSGIIQDFAVINMLQQTVCANAWGGLSAPWFGASPQTAASHRPLGETVHGGFVPRDRTPYKALKMKTPFKILHDDADDLMQLRVVQVSTFTHIKNSTKLDTAALEGVRL